MAGSWSSIPDMSTKRYNPSAASDANGNIYAIGGSDRFGRYIPQATGSVEKWDGSSWSSISDISTGRESFAAASDANGNIYAIGGEDSNGDKLSSAEKYTIPTAPSAPTGLTLTVQ